MILLVVAMNEEENGIWKMGKVQINHMVVPSLSSV
jgi:hypothetical protein